MEKWKKEEGKRERGGDGGRNTDLALVGQQKQSRHERQIFFTCFFISSFVPEWGDKTNGKKARSEDNRQNDVIFACIQTA